MKNLILILFVFGMSCFAFTQENYNPGKTWKKFVNAEDAGFDISKLDNVRQQFIENGGDVLLVIRSGKVVLSEGDVTRSFRQTSVRKSYLNALYGIYVSKGDIDLNSTLEELNIDDNFELTQTEKQAAVLDLLQSRSGVYHPAAYSPESMENRLPPRGSAAPGEKWFYNNWDFNTLGTVFTDKTGLEIFEAFENRIAKPLNFQDFDRGKTKYVYEQAKSMHPAYTFRISARDMARFGVLYLNRGNWNGQQIVPENWIDESFSIHSENGIDSEGTHWDDYGLLWWISRKITEEPVVYASGSGVQRIMLFPQSDMVMVHLTDNFQPKQVGEEKVDQLAKLLINARTGNVNPNAKTVAFLPKVYSIDKAEVSKGKMALFEKDYQNPRLGNFSISVENDFLRLETGIGNFKLVPTGQNSFINEDIRIPMEFVSNNNKNGVFEVVMNKNRSIEKFVFYY